MGQLNAVWNPGTMKTSVEKLVKSVTSNLPVNFLVLTKVSDN